MGILTLETLSYEHTILWLFNNRFVPSILLANSNCCSNASSWPLRSSPIKSFSSFNNVMESCTSFLKRSLIIGSVAENNIDIFKLESFKRVIKSFNNMLSWIKSIIYTWSASHQLGRDNKIFSSVPKFLESYSHLFLSFTINSSINFCSVKKINTMFEALFNALSCESLGTWVVRIDPVSVWNDWYLKTRVS